MTGHDLGALGKSLLSLEINTIVKAGITTAQMPPAPHALLDVAQTYWGALHRLGVDAAAYLLAPVETGPPCLSAAPEAAALRMAAQESRAPLDDAALSRQLLATVTTFQRLRLAARRRQTGRVAPGTDVSAADEPTAAERLLTVRIIDNCDTLSGVLSAPFAKKLAADLRMSRSELAAQTQLGPYGLPPEAMLALRKIWEIGDEEVVAQTVVHLTGDVVTRVVPRLTRAEAAPLVALHRQSVETSLSTWRNLAEAAGWLIDGLLGGRSRRD